MVHPALLVLGHRPFPPPRAPWAVAMRWLDLAFLHWPVPAANLQPLLPPDVEVEEHGGTGWLGVVPFRMVGVRARCLPPLPGSSAFAELNVRTYVHHRGVAGVWFFSLDAASKLAVRAARRTYRLPYFDADMRCQRRGEAVDYACQRTHKDAAPAHLVAHWWPTTASAPPRGDTLAHWLVERYALFTTARDGSVRVGHIHHPPWQLAAAEVELQTCDMTRLLGIHLDGSPLLVHAAAPLDVVAWAPRRAGVVNAGSTAGRS